MTVLFETHQRQDKEEQTLLFSLVEDEQAMRARAARGGRTDGYLSDIHAARVAHALLLCSQHIACRAVQQLSYYYLQPSLSHFLICSSAQQHTLVAFVAVCARILLRDMARASTQTRGISFIAITQ